MLDEVIKWYSHNNPILLSWRHWGVGWGANYINPPKGPPCVVSGEHIANDDDWATAPPKGVHHGRSN